MENSNVGLKDSVYCAIGLAAPVLDTKLDFGNFLTSTLAPEVPIQRSGYHILRRRIAIVLGQWLPVQEGLNRPLVYQIFQYLLDPNSHNDKVIRITAGRQFKNIVDPFEFDGEQFKPFAKAIIASLLRLIAEVELIDTKLALLNTLSSIVLRMEIHVGLSNHASYVPANRYRLPISPILSCTRCRHCGTQQVKSTYSSNRFSQSPQH